MVLYIDSTLAKMKKREIIEELVSDVERLMKLHEEATSEIAALRAKSAEQSAKIRSMSAELKQAKEEVSRLSLRQAIGGEGTNKAAARVQVNRLLREVDKCIAMVSNKI